MNDQNILNALEKNVITLNEKLVRKNEIRIYNNRSFDTMGYRNRISVNVIEQNKWMMEKKIKENNCNIKNVMEQSVCI